MPSAFQFIGSINDGPEFYTEFVDFKISSIVVFVVTLIVYVATL